MHVLHDELRAFKNIELKHCQKMKFSYGGHLFFAADMKFLYVFNAYTLENITKIKCPPMGISEIIIGEKDSSFAICSLDGYINRYKLPTFQIIKESS